MEKQKTAITPTRSENFPEWYQQVVRAADMAENSPVRGCMVIRPWGYGVWERMQRDLDRRIKETGHENAYFPLFIPLSFLEKEASHVEGFAKECAVVTHHRLEMKDGKLVPGGKLEEPLVVRPTSETIIGEMFAKWVQSYRDLPLLINQWANVVRWEMRTRVFLRTMEFLWQEGHTAHATEAEAREETLKMLEVYRSFCEEIMAIPLICGEKSADERFAGAVSTYTIEAMMQDGKALQAGTSHYMGENFARASEIKYLSESGELKFCHTTSWGVSTRLIGGLIMIHADDDGMRLPPRIAPKQVVVLPVIPKPELEAEVLEYAERVAATLRVTTFFDQPVEVVVDKRDIRGGEKSWQWVKKGIPIRIEVGPRDIKENKVMLCRRDKAANEKQSVSFDELANLVPQILTEMQRGYFSQAREMLERRIDRQVSDFEQFKEYFSGAEEGAARGFVRAKWCGEPESVALLEPLKVTIRCLPLDQSGTTGKCVLTGKPATIDAIFGKNY